MREVNGTIRQDEFHSPQILDVAETMVIRGLVIAMQGGGAMEAIRVGRRENKEPLVRLIKHGFPQSKPRWLIEPV